MDLTRWDGTHASKPRVAASKKPAMTVQLTGANYIKPRPATIRPPLVANVSERSPEFQQEGFVQLQPNSPTQPQSAPSNSAPTNGAPVAPAPGLANALAATQQSILALQKMQEQTAHLHQQYLQGQEQAQRTIHQLMEQQMQLLGNACGISIPAAATQLSAPGSAVAFGRPINSHTPRKRSLPRHPPQRLWLTG